MVLPLKSNLFGKTFAWYYIFLTFYKTKFEFPREFFSATIRSITGEGVKILKSQKYPLVNSPSLFFNRKKSR